MPSEDNVRPEDVPPSRLTAEDLAFHDRLSAITSFVGRALLVGIPSLFAVGVLLVPLRGTIPSAVIMMIILAGSAAIVLIAERLRGRKQRLPRGAPLIGRRAMLVFGIGLGMYLVLATAIAVRA